MYMCIWSIYRAEQCICKQFFELEELNDTGNIQSNNYTNGLSYDYSTLMHISKQKYNKFPLNGLNSTVGCLRIQDVQNITCTIN